MVSSKTWTGPWFLYLSTKWSCWFAFRSQALGNLSVLNTSMALSFVRYSHSQGHLGNNADWGGGGSRFLSPVSRPLKPYLRNGDRNPSCYQHYLSLCLFRSPPSCTYLNSVAWYESTSVGSSPLVGPPVGRAKWRWVVWGRQTTQRDLPEGEVSEKMVVGTWHSKPSRMNDAREVFLLGQWSLTLWTPCTY